MNIDNWFTVFFLVSQCQFPSFAKSHELALPEWRYPPGSGITSFPGGKTAEWSVSIINGFDEFWDVLWCLLFCVSLKTLILFNQMTQISLIISTFQKMLKIWKLSSMLMSCIIEQWLTLALYQPAHWINNWIIS